MVTHDERLIGHCDKVYYMQDGALTLDQEKTQLEPQDEEAVEDK